MQRQGDGNQRRCEHRRWQHSICAAQPASATAPARQRELVELQPSQAGHPLLQGGRGVCGGTSEGDWGGEEGGGDAAGPSSGPPRRPGRRPAAL